MCSPITPDIAAREAGTRAGASLAATTLLLLVFLAAPAAAQDTQDDSPTSQSAAPSQVTTSTVTCSSKPGERSSCAADTSKGVVLLRPMGAPPCLLGRTWGYDQTSVWVQDGCSAEFGTGPAVEPETTKPKAPTHVPNVGFLLFDGDKGQVYFRLFSYGRYLNQRNLDESYIDAFGNTKTVQRRQDIQLQKFFALFSGWFLTPKMRYYLYVWSSNASQGDPAQGVGAGKLTRIGVHYSHSLEEKQSQPGTEGIENSQIRLTDGSIIFTPDLFGPGITATTSGSSTKDVAGCEPGKQRM